MITFSIVYLGAEEDLEVFEDFLGEALSLNEDAAFDLAEQCADMGQEVVIQASDAAFGHLCAVMAILGDAIGDDEVVEIEVHHREPDPAVYSIHTMDVQDEPVSVPIYTDLRGY